MAFQRAPEGRKKNQVRKNELIDLGLIIFYVRLLIQLENIMSCPSFMSLVITIETNLEVKA